MAGETNLTWLLKNMRPRLDTRPFVFCSVEPDRYAALTVTPIGLFHETEGITLILEQPQADGLGLAYSGVWALITLTVHSDLAAVGFLAAITAKLAAAGLSVNPVAGYYHDHLFIPWPERERALALLDEF